MEHGLLLLVLAGCGAAFMAFNNGANDVANSFASAVGAKAISMKQAVMIAGLMNLVGAILIGGNVSEKLITGILNPEEFGDAQNYVVAMFSVLFAAGAFVLVSSLTHLPVSSSHAIVGSLIGVSVAASGMSAVNWPVLQTIVISWFVSPFLAGGLSFLMLTFVQTRILKEPNKELENLRVWLPYLLAITLAVFVLILMKGSSLAVFRPGTLWEYGLFLGVLLPYATLVAQVLLRALTSNMAEGRESSERVFRNLQVGTSSYVAFAHGANDVANSISPVFAVYLVVSSAGQLPTTELVGAHGVPLWILVLGGGGIALGIAVLGHRVIQTLSKEITELDNFKGFSVDFAAATTVVLASVMGLPVSSTHAATGAIIGTGVREGKGMNTRVLLKIVVAWVVTVPVAATISVGLYFLLKSAMA